ncbi:MAG TPA: PHB depolymerase family esterase, partial [Kofleriaceae bacterium]|nr:PHB depolymerase family esterase [Kofleriaceae bacterium]
IALHGNGSTGRQMERLTSFDAVAAREQFVVVYPDAIDHHWNDGRPEFDTAIDDISFVASLIDETAREHAIDRSRVYVTGASNGGMMTYRVGCELADRLAGIAPVIGNLPATIRCEPRVPVSVLAINGTDDPLVPYEGGSIAHGHGRGSVLSATLSTATFAHADGCTGAEATVDEPDIDTSDGSRTRRTQFACPAPLAVELLTLDGAGHTWPGGPQYLPRALIGGTSRDFDGAERIWEFFSAHSRS